MSQPASSLTGDDDWYADLPVLSAADVELPAPFAPADDTRMWALDFHYPSGVTPLGIDLVGDLVGGSQHAARSLCLAGVGGLAARVRGSHVYLGAAATDGSGRDALPDEELQRFEAGFRASWGASSSALAAELDRLEAVALGEDLRGHLLNARDVHRRAWRLHFAVMYPLALSYRRFTQTLQELGIEPALAAPMLQGEWTSVLAADSALWDLAEAARADDLADVLLTTPPAQLESRLAGHPWWGRLTDTLRVHGRRTSEILDVRFPPWCDDPVPALEIIRTHLADPGRHRYDHPRAVAERDEAAALARASLDPVARPVFDDALARARRANFAWWNEEHDVVIDLRAHLPLRRAAVAIAAAAGAPDAAHAVFCSYDELLALADGTGAWSDVVALVDVRRAQHAAWLAGRSALPRLQGSTAAVPADPVLGEILGFREVVTAGTNAPGSATLSGLGVSAGVARGPARVLRGPSDLSLLRPGDVLVCEATSPSWTPAFAWLAACVCDQGGMLTHAAIVSREYGVPSVCGVGVATSVIRSGDLLEVDGTAGTVAVLQRSAD